MELTFSGELEYTVLVETVLTALRMDEKGLLETSESDDLYRFAGVCAEIAAKAIVEKRRAYEEYGVEDGWDVMYDVIDDELLKVWGKKEADDVSCED